MSSELDLINKPKFRPGTLTGLAAKKAAIVTELARTEPGKVAEFDPNTVKDRIGIVFDDSGSMYGNRITDAIEGTEEFLRSCAKGQTAIAIYPMNAAPLQLNSNLPAVAIYVKGIGPTGGTPLLSTLQNMQRTNNLTRCIVFSDGSPNDARFEKYELLAGIPVDTVSIDCNEGDEADRFMSELAKRTGGIYLRFERSKSNFRTAFKYLSPGLRYMLADKSFVQKLEGK